jgi:excisionase family DNA binding protein
MGMAMREQPMTLPAHSEELGSRLPSASERAVANRLREILAAQIEHGARLRVLEKDEKTPVELVLTPAISSLLMEVLRYLGKGDAVTLVPVSQMLTTQQAADILNVSRPFLISLLNRNEIAHVMVGRHRRIKAEDLFAYKRQRGERRSNALSALAALDAETL